MNILLLTFVAQTGSYLADDPRAGWARLSFAASLFIVSFAIWLIPGLVASARRHPHAASIWVLSLALGWTGIVWFAAFLWSFSGQSLLANGAIPSGITAR